MEKGRRDRVCPSRLSYSRLSYSRLKSPIKIYLQIALTNRLRMLPSNLTAYVSLILVLEPAIASPKLASRLRQKRGNQAH